MALAEAGERLSVVGREVDLTGGDGEREIAGQRNERVDLIVERLDPAPRGVGRRRRPAQPVDQLAQNGFRVADDAEMPGNVALGDAPGVLGDVIKNLLLVGQLPFGW